MRPKISKPFEAQYSGQFCVLCDNDIIPEEMICFVDEEIAHAFCSDERYGRMEYKPAFTFDPVEWSK